mgnify:CR=1 FL=1
MSNAFVKGPPNSTKTIGDTTFYYNENGNLCGVSMVGKAPTRKERLHSIFQHIRRKIGGCDEE